MEKKFCVGDRFEDLRFGHTYVLKKIRAAKSKFDYCICNLDASNKLHAASYVTDEEINNAVKAGIIRQL